MTAYGRQSQLFSSYLKLKLDFDRPFPRFGGGDRWLQTWKDWDRGTKFIHLYSHWRGPSASKGMSI